MAETILNKNQAGSGIWTSDTLIAGDNISITQVVNPVIDEHTVELYHFDNNLFESISSQTATTISGSYSFTTGKFNECMASTTGATYVSSPSSTSLDSNDTSISFDCWFKVYAFQSGTSDAAVLLGGGDSWAIELKSDQITLGSWISGTGSNKTISLSNNLQLDTWYHIAYTLDKPNNTIYLFLNGSLVSSWTRTSRVRMVRVGGCELASIDEARLSNVARWTANFTPYSQPYQAASGESQYQINADLTTVADTSLSNVTDTGTSSSAGWAMPSTSYENITVGASGATYQAPANGYFTAVCGGDVHIVNYSTNMSTTTAGTTLGGGSTYVPVKKGDNVVISYSTADYLALLFIYAEGSKSEAN